MRAFLFNLAGLLIAAAVASCGDDSNLSRTISPQEPGPDSVAYYCGMNISEHAGPKGQIFLKGQQKPVWFASVRDTLAFTMLPGEPNNIAAIFVSDVGNARRWDQLEAEAWVEANKAIFVAGSNVQGGMGAAELVPFAKRAAAEQFQAKHGGEIYRLDDLPERYILGEADVQTSSASDPDAASKDMAH